jgi:hypothetical protein
MHYSAVDYFSLGNAYPRSRLREPYPRPVRKIAFAAILPPIVYFVFPDLLWSTQYSVPLFTTILDVPLFSTSDAVPLWTV